MTTKITKILVAAGLVALGVLGRTVFDLPPNVELVTLSTFLASAYLGGIFAPLVPLAIMVVSDVVIGNTPIFIFTWSAYIFVGIGALLLRRHKNNDVNLVSAATLGAVPSSLFFYFWTNFGVWYQGWYPPTLHGLLESYTMGLPFLKFNLVGNLIFVPLGFGLIALAHRKCLSTLRVAKLFKGVVEGWQP
jgi:hypothetical protein